jgi:hypothetical protein
MGRNFRPGQAARILAKKAPVQNKTVEQTDAEKNANVKTGKYKSRGVWRDGIYFHSTGEANYWEVLKIELARGEYADIKRQVRIKIVINGVLICTYVADFVITHLDGRKEVRDYKSEFTRTLAEYKIKKQLLAALYKINIVEIIKGKKS